MSLDQLNQLREQQESQLQALTSRFAQLRGAAARLQASDQAVLELGPSSESKEVMVPLTSSLYVPAKILDPNKLLVELGTGFYAQKTVKECSAFLQRKLRLVDQNSENITVAIQNARQNLESINTAMQGKMMEIRARQEGHKMQSIAEE
jgi:prefoldin alpha subunit